MNTKELSDRLPEVQLEMISEGRFSTSEDSSLPIIERAEIIYQNKGRSTRRVMLYVAGINPEVGLVGNSNVSDAGYDIFGRVFTISLEDIRYYSIISK